MTEFRAEYGKNIHTVVNEIEEALLATDIQGVCRLKDDLCGGHKIFLVGVGRVMMSLEAFAKRLTHIGIEAHCVGDVTEPAIMEDDILIVASGSGESIVPVAIAKKAKELGVKKVIHIGSNPQGAIAQYTDYFVRIPVRTRLYLDDEIESNQIMTSLFEQALLIMGDIIAMSIVNEQNIDLRELWQFHANLE